MKAYFLSFIILMASLLTFSAPIFAKDGNSISFFENGAWIELKKYEKTFDLDNDGLIRDFKVTKRHKHFTNARGVAEYIRKHLLGSFPQIKTPSPCGIMEIGTLKRKFRRINKSATTFTQKGSGNESKDTCTGTTFPYGWSHTLKVRYNSTTGRGEMTYKGWTE